VFINTAVVREESVKKFLEKISNRFPSTRGTTNVALTIITELIVDDLTERLGTTMITALNRVNRKIEKTIIPPLLDNPPKK
jgi:hypothetical protein